MYGRGNGPPNAKIFVVGECFGTSDEARGHPFTGTAGDELDRMLHDAGIMRSECFVSNVVNARPQHNRVESWIPVKKKDVTSRHVPFRNRFVDPIIVKGYESLIAEISLVRPNIIIALGGVALWALTGREGILRWRGSQIWTDTTPAIKLIPTVHPSAILRE
jgi:DNA polymerase